MTYRPTIPAGAPVRLGRRALFRLTAAGLAALSLAALAPAAPAPPVGGGRIVIRDGWVLLEEDLA
ncbi:hypothetical protein [Thioalkalivibrio sp.]|uniref:hypothetical protein n=1 Tax=Thioalkalivibrio sp. TaxID=2093813 RepID=UPI0039759B2C